LQEAQVLHDLQAAPVRPRGADTPTLGGCGSDAVWEEKTDSMEEEWEVKPEDEEDSDLTVHRQQSGKLVPALVVCTDSPSLQDQHCLQKQLLEAQGEIAGLRLALEAARRREQYAVSPAGAMVAGSSSLAGHNEERSTSSSSSMPARRQASGGRIARGAVSQHSASRQSSSPSRVTAQRLQDLRALQRELQAQRLSLGRLARGVSVSNQARSRTPSPEFAAKVGERKRVLETIEKAVESLQSKIAAEAANVPPLAMVLVSDAEPGMVDLPYAVRETMQTLNGLRPGSRSLTPPPGLANVPTGARSVSPRSGHAQVLRSLTPPAGIVQARQTPLRGGIGAGQRNRRPLADVGVSSATYLCPDRARARSPVMSARQPLASCSCLPPTATSIGASPVDSCAAYGRPALRWEQGAAGAAASAVQVLSVGGGLGCSGSSSHVLPVGTLASARGFSTTSSPCFVAPSPCIGSGGLSSGNSSAACAAASARHSGWSRSTHSVLPPQQCWGMVSAASASGSSTRGLGARANCVRSPGKE